MPLDARARQIFDYFRKYNYSVKDRGEVIVFEGVYAASASELGWVGGWVPDSSLDAGAEEWGCGAGAGRWFPLMLRPRGAQAAVRVA
jgi:hypothetical protein